MARSIAKLLCAGSLIALSTVSAHVFAQPPATSFDRFRPSPAAESFFFTEAAEVADTRLSLASTLGYARHVLQLRMPNETIYVLRNQSLGYVGVSFDLKRTLKLYASVPIVIAQDGSGAYGKLEGADFEKPSGPGFGSPFLGARVQLLRQSGPWPAASLAFRVYLPIQNSSSYISEASAKYEPSLLVGATYSRWLWALSAWECHRGDSSALQFFPGSEIGLSAAVAARLGVVTLGPEFYWVTAASSENKAFSRSSTSAELLFGAKVSSKNFSAGLAAGTGFARGPGTPELRALATLAYSWTIGQPHAAPILPNESDVDALSGNDVLRTEQGRSKATTPVRQGSAAAHAGQDFDADGVIDEQDACPRTYASDFDPQRPGCPRDSDGDGIADAQDACPSEAGVAQPEVSRNGCPPDADGDGIADQNDACPGEKGVKNADPKLNGCSPTVRIEGPQIVIAQQIRFDRGKDRILEESFPILQAVADIMQEHEEITRLAVDGHTDDAGTAAQNLQLSQRRAIAVGTWLIEHGVDARRIETRSFGARRPLATNKAEEGRSLNRRVEFQIRKRSSQGKKAWIEGAIEQ